MRKRCSTCKCLEEESSVQFYKRTKSDPNARFYCRKCKPEKKRKNEIKNEVDRFKAVCQPEVERLDEERKIKFNEFNKTETAKKGRRRYENTNKGKGACSIRTYNHRMRSMKTGSLCQNVSEEEKMAIGRFYRMCPVGFQVDHIIPLCKGGKHELSNLQYLSIEQHRKKSAKERTKIAKVKVKEIYPFTPVCEQPTEIQVGPKKRNKGSKFKRVRRLVEK